MVCAFHTFNRSHYQQPEYALKSIALTCILLLPCLAIQAQPIRLHPENPHYFLFQGKPALLITSAEHYGAVLNPDFDYLPYLAALAEDSLNYTRIFTGSYFEPSGAFGIEKNTLAPAGDRAVTPWARSSTPGYGGGGNKLDLDRWNPAYFTRLKDFVTEAGRRGIVVEVTLFTSIYGEEQWKINPLNPANNVNEIAPVQRSKVNTLDNGNLLAYQEKLVRKIVRELNGFDNVIFEIQNEPWADNGRVQAETNSRRAGSESNWQDRVEVANDASLEWQDMIASYIASEEASLPKKHLIAQNYSNFEAPVEHVVGGVSIINFHYARPEAVRLNYGRERVIGFDESGFAGSADSTYRRQAWRFVLAGGGLFNNLDYSFTVDRPGGTDSNKAPGGGSPALRDQLRILKSFMQSLDFVSMRPDLSFIQQAPNVTPQALANPGEAYAIYLDHPLQSDLVLALRAGAYNVEWIDPRTGKTLFRDRIQHTGGTATLKAPSYDEDVALRIVRATG